MSTDQFLLVWAVCLATMLACRCLPMFILKGRELPAALSEALNLIPPAAFAALVANDLVGPSMFDSGVYAGIVPLVAAAVVVLVARQTRSLIWCAVAGVAAYAVLMFLS